MQFHVHLAFGQTLHIQLLWAYSFLNTDNGGFQLVDLIITELKSHMTYYNSMPLIGWNYTQYGPIKNGRIKNQGSDFEKK